MNKQQDQDVSSKKVVKMVMELDNGSITKDSFICSTSDKKTLFDFIDGNGTISEDATYEDLETIYYHAQDMLKAISLYLQQMDEEEFESLQKENEELRAKIKQLEGGVSDE